MVVKWDDAFPNVSTCLGRACIELRQVGDGVPQGVVTAAVLLATASRSLERESFAKIMSFVDIDGPETIAVALVQDSMEKTFDHTLEALGHITVLGICKDLEDRIVQLQAAEHHTSMALEAWSSLHSLNIMAGPKEIQ
jgi:hypothetical protein